MGSEPGREGGCREGREPGGAGLDSLVSLPSAQPKLDPSLSGGRALVLLLQIPGESKPPRSVEFVKNRETETSPEGKGLPNQSPRSYFP